jgi:hypothetical protein
MWPESIVDLRTIAGALIENFQMQVSGSIQLFLIEITRK